MDKRFKIGDWVSVKAVVRFVWKDKGEKAIERECVQFDGQIVGATYKKTGHLECGYHSYDGEYEPAYFSPNKTVFVWKVVRGITNKPLYVLPEDVVSIEFNNLWDMNSFPELPFRWTNNNWPEDAKKSWSEEISAVPRDLKGRFVKC